jgi:hypothetical protein
MGVFRLRIWASGEGCCEHGNELSCSIKCQEILEPHNWWLLKKATSPRVSWFVPGCSHVYFDIM